jgi:cell division protein FtsB|tara:strand:- start:1369 stop:1761 length:393 start_codon:yes stop_codon:yes gene_type:complete
MANLKTFSNNVFSRLLTFTLVASFLFFLFDTYQESYDKYKALQNSLEDRQEEVVLIQNQIDEWNSQMAELDDPEKAELILRKRGYGEPGEVLYRFEVPEPVTPIEETIKSERNKSLLEYAIDFVVGRESE